MINALTHDGPLNTISLMTSFTLTLKMFGSFPRTLIAVNLVIVMRISTSAVEWSGAGAAGDPLSRDGAGDPVPPTPPVSYCKIFMI